MPLFVCDCCGAVDNTACGGNYWSKSLDDNPERVPDLCCKCYTGEWHNKFPYELCTAEVFNEIGEDNFIYEFPVQNPRKNGMVISGGRGPGNPHISVGQMLAFAEVSAAMAGLPSPSPRIRHRPETTCQLPGCKNTTRHRGGYCSPECCREHQKSQGKRLKALGR